MSAITCRTFRARLERALRGRPEQPEAASLAWHEHLLGCAECRAFLEAEEALEELLASLPEPHLPHHLATRVLARLEAHRPSPGSILAASRLDALLELDGEPAIPADLSSRVLAGLSAARHESSTISAATRGERQLDSLLDSVPAPHVPDDLAARVLAALEPVRRPAPRLRLLRRRAWRVVVAAALVVVMGLAAWKGFGGATVDPNDPSGYEAVDEELIASLDVLERWDLLMTNDIDLLLAGLDPVAEALLDADTIGAETREEESQDD